MAYDEELAERVRLVLADEFVTEKKMFGGLSFLLGGNMSVGVMGEDLLVRIPRDERDALLAMPHVREMAFTGRPMNGWVLVGPEATADETGLQEWVGRGITFAKSLPAKW